MDSKTLSRREFLSEVAQVAAGVGIQSIAGDPIVGIILSSSDYARSAVLTAEQSMQPKYVEDVLNGAELETTPLYSVSELDVLRSDGTTVSLVKTEVQNYDTFNIRIPSGRPEDILRAYPDNYIVVGPTGYKTGDYYRKNLSMGHPVVDFSTPAMTTNGEWLGPSDIVDRFPGLSQDINNASGGYYIDKVGNFVITDKAGLETAKSMHIPFAQLVYYIDNVNKDLVLNQTWTNKFKQNVRIGDTTYYWSMYVQVPNGAGVRTLILTCQDKMVPISNMIEVVEKLSPNGQYKIALADGGNGSTVLTNNNAYGVNGYNTHLTPMAPVFIPKNQL